MCGSSGSGISLLAPIVWVHDSRLNGFPVVLTDTTGVQVWLLQQTFLSQFRGIGKAGRVGLQPFPPLVFPQRRRKVFLRTRVSLSYSRLPISTPGLLMGRVFEAYLSLGQFHFTKCLIPKIGAK